MMTAIAHAIEPRRDALDACPACKGTGRRWDWRNDASAHITDCHDCAGSGIAWPTAALPCVHCDGWCEVGELVATKDEWVMERGPFVLCQPCGGTGTGFEIGGEG